MCAYLDRRQGTVILGVVVVFAVVHSTFDAFITFFHVHFLLHSLSCGISMSFFPKKHEPIFFFLHKKYGRIFFERMCFLMAEKKTGTKSTAKKTPAGKKLSVTLDVETMAMLTEYLTEYGYSKDEFVKKAILEKISRDKISSMIDSMITR